MIYLFPYLIVVLRRAEQHFIYTWPASIVIGGYRRVPGCWQTVPLRHVVALGQQNLDFRSRRPHWWEASALLRSAWGLTDRRGVRATPRKTAKQRRIKYKRRLSNSKAFAFRNKCKSVHFRVQSLMLFLRQQNSRSWRSAYVNTLWLHFGRLG